MKKKEIETAIPSSRYQALRKSTTGKQISENLNKLRLMADLTQIQVSTIIGINRETYSNYEKGRCKVPSNIILELANMYEIPIDLIFGRTDTPIVKDFYKKM